MTRERLPDRRGCMTFEFDHARMTPEQFRKTIESLGLTQFTAAALLGVHPRTTSRWANDERGIPGPVCQFLRYLERTGRNALRVLKAEARAARSLPRHSVTRSIPSPKTPASEWEQPCKRGESAVSINEAIATLKANGYRVSKPKPPKGKDRAGPTFVATFRDGEVTRMSTFTSLTNLDVGRGVRLSEAAYRSRKKTEIVPPIMKAHFERDGKALAHYSPDALGAPPTSLGAAS
jgi:hypothetical protein